MKAAVIYGAKDLRVEDIQEPVVSNGLVKVQVAWAGICGSDLHAYHHGVGVSLEPHPLTGKKVPLVLGHEFAGKVVEVGEGVTRVSVGDRVAVEPLLYSENDPYVRQGKYNLANDIGFLGLQDDGGFAQFVSVSTQKVNQLPDRVSLEEGALVEPTSVAMQAVKQSRLKIGQTVVVFGAGPIGLLTIVSAKAAGASKIIAVDISEERLCKALEVGADVVINNANASVEEKVLAMTQDGVDVAYDAAGVQETFTSALNVIKKGGQLMIIAGFLKPVTLDVNRLLMFKEATISASFAFRHIFPEVIALIAAGKIDVKKLITKKIKLEDIVEEGLDPLAKDKSQAKILVEIPQQ